MEVIVVLTTICFYNNQKDVIPNEIFVVFSNCFVNWQGVKQVCKVKLVIIIKQVVINDTKFCRFHKKLSKMWD